MGEFTVLVDLILARLGFSMGGSGCLTSSIEGALFSFSLGSEVLIGTASFSMNFILISSRAAYY
jgi:hypothetical protein